MTPQTKNRLVTGRTKGVERMRDRSPENKQKGYFVSWGLFLESPGNLPGPKSVFGDKCFSTEVNFQ